MTDKIKFRSKGYVANPDQIKMLKTFCDDFDIDVTVDDAGTEIITNKITEIEEALLEGLYYGVTSQSLQTVPSKEISVHVPISFASDLQLNMIGDYQICDQCVPKRGIVKRVL